jgi:hypothetical protein
VVRGRLGMGCESLGVRMMGMGIENEKLNWGCTVFIDS